VKIKLLRNAVFQTMSILNPGIFKECRSQWLVSRFPHSPRNKRSVDKLISLPKRALHSIRLIILSSCLIILQNVAPYSNSN